MMLVPTAAAARQLHAALKRQRPLREICSIVKQHPEAVATRVNEKASSSSSFNKSAPNDDDGWWDDFDDDDAHNDNDFLAIHVACKYGASLPVIQYLVQQYPESLTVVAGPRQCLPVHWACRYCHCYGGSVAVVRFLIEQQLDTLLAADAYGYLPVHYAAQQSSSLPIIRYLVDRYPDSVSYADYNKCLPMHYACQRDESSYEIVKCLVQKDPGSVLAQDNAGRLPLHYACDTKYPSLETIRYLVVQQQQQSDDDGCCLLVKDYQGHRPIHVACASGCSQTLVLQFLIEQSSNNNNKKTLVDDDNGNHLLHYCCHQCRSVHPNLVRFLIQNYPNAMRRKNRAGDLPLHVLCSAARRSLPRETLLALIQADPGTLLVENNKGQMPLEVLVDAANRRHGHTCSSSSNDDDECDDVSDDSLSYKEACRILQHAHENLLAELRSSFHEAITNLHLPESVVDHVFLFAVPPVPATTTLLD